MAWPMAWPMTWPMAWRCLGDALAGVLPFPTRARRWIPGENYAWRPRKWWPAGNGVMRRPLAPPPCRPNPTDPGDAADLSIPQGYQCDRRWACARAPELTGPRVAFHRLGQSSATASEINKLGCG